MSIFYLFTVLNVSKLIELHQVIITIFVGISYLHNKLVGFIKEIWIKNRLEKLDEIVVINKYVQEAQRQTFLNVCSP